jgi:hypothetical protein
MYVPGELIGYPRGKGSPVSRKGLSKGSPLVSAAGETPAGAQDKAPPVDQRLQQGRKGGKAEGEVEYLNERPSTFQRVL